MNDRGPWSVKGIDQRAREVARDAARMEGMTLGEYLNKLILEVSSDERPNEYRPSHSHSRAETSLDQIVRRIEAVEARSTLAITGIDQSVMGLVARLERAEDSTSVVAGHVDNFVEDLRETHAALSEKIRRLEEDDTGERNLQALRSLEQALAKLAGHVYEDGGRQQEESDAIRGRVEAGFVDLNDRMERVETRVESTLSEVAKRIEKAVEDAELRTEGAQRHLADQVRGLEQRVAKGIASSTAAEERLSCVEADVEGALGSMEQTLVRIQERLNRAERTTDAALKGLEGTFDGLDARISALSEVAGPEAAQRLRDELDRRFQGLSQELKAEVEAARAAMAREIAETATRDLAPDIAELGTSVSALADRFSASEARSAKAFQSVGEQVARISESFDKRLQDVETQISEAGSGPDAEGVARLSQHVEARLDEIEAREASVIERVGSEVGKLADRLEARVAKSETASARAISQIGEQVSSVAKRLQGRQDEAFGRLSAHVEETRSLQEARLSEALSSLSERVRDVRAEDSPETSPVQKAIASLASRLDRLERVGSQPAGTPAQGEDEDVLSAFSAAVDELRGKREPRPVQKAVGDDGFGLGVPEWALPVDDETDEDYAPTPPMPKGRNAPAPAPGKGRYDPLAALEDWGADDDLDTGEDEPRDSDVFDELPSRTARTRDIPPVYLDLDTDMPRAARSGAVKDEAAPRATETPAAPQDLVEDIDASDYIARARKAALAAASSSSAQSVQKPAGAGAGRVPLYAAASVIALAAVGTTGYLYLRGKQAVPETVTASAPVAAEALSVPDTLPEEGPSLEAFAGLAGSAQVQATPDVEPSAATEVIPEPATQLAAAPAVVAPAAATTPATPVAAVMSTPRAPATVASFAPIPDIVTRDQAAQSGDRIAQYLVAVDHLNASRFAEAADMMRKSASQGLPVAQYRLSKLHEKGLGLPRDLAAAREWTERAARGGNTAAMHDLAVYFADGEGGTQSYASAAEWFRKAAEFGVLDSQYNLAVLYQQGLGLTQDRAEALFWFSVAAANGDPGAPEQVRGLLVEVDADTAIAVRERVAAWRAAPPNGPANGEFGRLPWTGGEGERIRAVQVALSALGYEVGTPDGVVGPATRQAIRAYQAQAGLRETGTLNDELVASLNTKARNS